MLIKALAHTNSALALAASFFALMLPLAVGNGRAHAAVPFEVGTLQPTPVGAVGIAFTPDGDAVITRHVPSLLDDFGKRVTIRDRVGVTVADVKLPGRGTGFGLSPPIIGPDGNSWVGIWGEPERSGSLLVRITSRGKLRAFRLGRVALPFMLLAPGPDGKVWFTGVSGVVGSLAPDGRVRYMRTHRSFQISGIVQGADGAIWISRFDDDFFGVDGSATDVTRLTPSGRSQNFRGLPADSITLGQDRRVWLSVRGGFQTFDRSGRRKTHRLKYPHTSEGANRYPDVVAQSQQDGLLFFAGYLPGGSGTLVEPTIGHMSTKGLAEEQYIEQPNGVGLAALGKPSAASTAADGTVWILNTNRLTELVPRITSTGARSRLTIESLSADRESIKLRLDCRGIPGAYCWGRISAASSAPRCDAVRRRTYAIRPLNRLILRLPIRSCARGQLMTVEVTNKDPLSGATQRLRRTLRAS